MYLLSFFVLAVVPAGGAPTIEKVRSLRKALLGVAKTKGLSSELATEATHVAADATRVLDGKPDNAALLNVIDEYKHFMGDLMHRQEALSKRSDDSKESKDDMSAHLAALVPVLEGKVRKLLAHIQADSRVASEKEAAVRESLIKQCEGALTETSSVVEHALALDKALKSAHNYMVDRVADFGKQQEKLSEEITEGEVKILHAMLKQRHKLPIKSQLAILKRRQFSNCSYAKQLLKSHKDKGEPLYQQLEKMLPPALAEKVAPQAASKAEGHLSVAGSDGKIFVYSSNLKNGVKKTMDHLTAARKQLQQLLSVKEGKDSLDASERAKTQKMVADIDDVVAKISKTHDLKAQIEMSDDMESKVIEFSSQMVAAEKAKQAKTDEKASGQAKKA
jgi:hypothetical protein